MKLTNLQAQRLLGGCSMIDKDETTKLDPEIRLALAININRLMDHVLVFQRLQEKLVNQKIEERAKVSIPSMNGEAIDAVKRLTAIDEEIIVLQESTLGLENVKLKKITTDNLKLKENPKIKGDVIASLALIIKDFDDGKGDED
jgi:hydrogenase maturation factor HypF (carbamoyltransferase family)